MYRDRILDLHHDGLSERQIAREVRVSHTYVGKVIKRYDESNTDLRAQRSHLVKPKVDQTVSEYIECCRLLNPSIYGSEIRRRLLLDGVVHPVDIPSVSQINRVSHTQHAMTRKRIAVVPRESTAPTATEAVDAFLNEISNFRASKLHFFDESRVVKTTGNRKYGSAVLGEPAIEVQRYASNSNYTINLLFSINGVDFFSILDGPSNGMELLTFFDEALQLEREDGSTTLERGDCVIMDNCGFHHARFVEHILRNMFADCGITLLFQPPCSPDFNTCEFCFRQIKDYLRRYQLFAEHETKIATAEAILQISPENSSSYFCHCGYVF